MKVILILLIAMACCVVALLGYDAHYAGRLFQLLMLAFLIAIVRYTWDDFKEFFKDLKN